MVEAPTAESQCFHLYSEGLDQVTATNSRGFDFTLVTGNAWQALWGTLTSLIDDYMADK